MANTVANKAWETKSATNQQRYALFKLTGDSSYKTKKLTGLKASDLIKELSAKAKVAKKTKALPKVKAVTKAIGKPKAKPVTRKPKASSHYTLQGEGASELKADIKAIASHVIDASSSLRKSASSLESAINLLASLI